MRRWLVCLVLLALAGGCSRPSPQPAPQPELPVPKETVTAWQRRVITDRILPSFTDQAVVTGTDELTVEWSLDKDIPAMVRTSGPMVLGKEQPEKMVRARFGPGDPGRFEVWLEDVANSRVIIERKAAPTFTLGMVTADGQVVPARMDGAGAGPLVLDLLFDQPMNRESLERLGRLGQLEWLAPNHTRLTLTQTPPVLKIAPSDFFNVDGLRVKAPDVVLKGPDSEPYLERINLADGRKERLADLAPEIQEAQLSPDGTRLAVWVIERPGENDWRHRLQLADLRTGKTEWVDMQPTTLVWSGNKLVSFGTGPWGQEPGWAVWDSATGVAEHYSQGNLGHLAPAASPDGRTIAFLRPPVRPGSSPEAADPEKAYPVSLVLFDPITGQEREISDFTRTWWFAKEGDFRPWVAWSADGTRLIALDPLERSEGARLIQYDRKTGRTSTLLERLPLSPFGTRLAWSPDGQRIVAGRRVIPLDGAPDVKLPGWGTKVFWDATGRRLLTGMQDWDETVYVYDLTTGKQTELGPGLPVGWQGDWVYIIRWAASSLRWKSRM